MCLSPCHLYTGARPSVWYNLNVDLSVNIPCYQWRMSQARWRLAHWWRRWRCTNVNLGHRAGLPESHPTASRRRVMICIGRRSPVRRISWTFNLKYGVALSELNPKSRQEGRTVKVLPDKISTGMLPFIIIEDACGCIWVCAYNVRHKILYINI